MSRAVCITTINGPEHGSLPVWTDLCKRRGWAMYVAGDARSDDSLWLGHAGYLSLADQARQFPTLSATACTGRYGRKSFAYLAAMRDSASEIFETDDDNWPIDCVDFPTEVTYQSVSGTFAFNHLEYATGLPIWPRGYPLGHQSAVELGDEVAAPDVWQGGILGEPDVDAVCRKLNPRLSLEEYVGRALPVVVAPRTWCPLNSQATLWKREAFPLMQVLTSAGWRVEDILRGYVAQARGARVGVCGPLVTQERNAHDLRRDWEQESVMYHTTTELLHCGCALVDAERLGWCDGGWRAERAAWERELEQILG